MSIRVKLFCIGGLFILAVGIFGTLSYSINGKRAIVQERGAALQELVFAVFERNLFFHDYLSSETDRARRQLITRNTDVGVLMEKAIPLFQRPERIALLTKISEENHRVITEQMDEYFTLHAESGAEQMARKQRLSVSIFEQSQGTVVIVEGLSRENRRDIQVLQEQAAITLVLYGIVSMLIALFALFGIFSITRRINALRFSTEEIMEGNLAHRADVRSSDELGKLGSSFNSMTGKLQMALGTLEEKIHARTAELEHERASLDAKVRARTRELERKIVSVEQFTELTEAREAKMIELKARIQELESAQNKG
jgi:nitrate/nitrite-specific signal transduction histidine kinase